MSDATLGISLHSFCPHETHKRLRLFLGRGNFLFPISASACKP